jgi:hypothetical protein
MRIVILVFAILFTFKATLFSAALNGEYDLFWDNLQTTSNKWSVKLVSKLTETSQLSVNAYYQNLKAGYTINGIQFPDKLNDFFLNPTLQIGRFSLDIQSGCNISKSDAAFFIAPSLNHHSDIRSIRLKYGAGYRYGYLDEKPLDRSLHIPSQGWHAQVGFAIRSFEASINFEQVHINGIDYTRYKSILVDTSFFSIYYDMIEPSIDVVPVEVFPIQSNRINKISAYFYGPVRKWLYLGAFFGYKKAKNNLYILTDDTTAESNNQIMTDYCFDYFPYKSPQKQLETGISLSLIFTPGRIWHLVKFDGKIPVVSTGKYRGYYVPDDRNLLNNFSVFDYNASGLAPLKLDCTMGYKLGRISDLELKYSFFSEPYAKYSFFRKDYAYRYSVLSIRLVKHW